MSEKSRFSFPGMGPIINSLPAEVTLLMNMSKVAVLVVDPRRLDILQVNQSASDLTGYEARELEQRNLSEIFDDWNEKLLQVSMPIIHRSRQALFEPILKIKRKDGDLLPVTVKYWSLASNKKNYFLVLESRKRITSTTPPSDARQQDGALFSLFSSFISELIEAQSNGDSQAAFPPILSLAKTLTDAQNLAVYITDQSNSLLSCAATLGNAEWLPEQIPAHELVHLKSGHIWTPGKRVTSVLHQAAQSAKQSYLSSFKIGLPLSMFGLLVLSGQNSPEIERIQQLGQAITALINQVLQIVSQESKQSETRIQLDAAINLVKAIQDHINEGSLVLSPERIILEINQAAIDILGYKPEQVRGQSLERVLIGTESLRTVLLDMQTQQGDMGPFDVRLYRRSGEAFLAQIRSYPILVDGKLDRILILLKDLSEQEYIQEQTRQLEQRAILGEVTAVFAHEVRNPINNISTGLELIGMSLLPEDPNQATIKRLIQDCDRLAELMKSVLAFSRPADYPMKEVLLEPFLQNLFERLRPRMERVNVNGSLQIEPGCPPILGSLRALEQVFVNLINNSIQAMSETGGQLMLRAQRAKEMDSPRLGDHATSIEPASFIEISVIDNGPGIPPEVQERIFQPFYTTNSSGTGLGLAICKRIITAHRGSIRLTSIPGGTVFQVFLPTV